MENLKIILSISLFFTICLFLACEKEIKIKDQSSLSVRADGFEQLGMSHNMRLTAVAGMPNFQSASLREMFNYGRSSIPQQFITSSDTSLSAWSQHLLAMQKSYYLVENGQSASTYLIANNYITSNIGPLVDSLAYILDNAANFESQTYKSAVQFTSEIEQLENFIYKNYTCNYDQNTQIGNDVALVLGACSIAKYSYSYWMDAINNASHPWFNRMSKITYTAGKEFTDTNLESRICFKCIWHGIKVAAVDVWSFMTAPNCGTATSSGGYDLGCAADYAGEKSSQVD